MGVNDSPPWWEGLLVFVVGATGGLGTVALLLGFWIEGVCVLACAALAGLGVPRDVALFLAGICLYLAVAWHVSLWLFGSGSLC